ncbi:DUF4276 family protein [Planctopirus hydrillae]|uniref:DUF4276 family protein n=1 Tax=Planctopirus hydrillae TaxID=1841610 RepID=A0A1C3EKC6_9PLAN|nr:DUF4276 family protein [Planctopirus hydrillae]ODA33683.1 hypothetical protein A6X21_18315 [Planctopirus hydrillae]
MSGWRQIHLKLFVTGEGEETFLATFFRQLRHFESGEVIITADYAFPQITVSTNAKKLAKHGKEVLEKIDKATVKKIRPWLLTSTGHYAVLVDDLETERRFLAESQFNFYQEQIHRILDAQPEIKNRFSVHFFVNMIEAYYFKHPEVVNQVCKTLLGEYPGDVENIRHPKQEIDKAIRSIDPKEKFREIKHGASIAKKLDLRKVLENPQHCRALRTLVAWIWEAMGRKRSQEYQLEQGLYWDVTVTQLAAQPPASQIRPLDAEE